ncbi:hypothetical protein D3C83_159360 [compost metagenome]
MNEPLALSANVPLATSATSATVSGPASASVSFASTPVGGGTVSCVSSAVV